MPGPLISHRQPLGAAQQWAASLLTAACVATLLVGRLGGIHAAEDAPTAAASDATRSEQNHQRLQLAAQARRAFLSGNVEQAMQLAQEALELCRTLFGDDDLRVAWRQRTLANYALELEQPEEAMRWARRAAEAVRRSRDPEGWHVEDADRFVREIEGLATLPRSKRQQFLHAAREVELAAEVHEYRRALAATQFRAGVLIELFGERDLGVVRELLSMQDLLIQMHQTEGVERTLFRLERLIPQVSRTPNPAQGTLYLARALLAETVDDMDRAEQCYQRAIDYFVASDLPFHVDLPTAHNNYAVLLDETERFRRAAEHYQRAGQLWRDEVDDSCWAYYRIQDNRVRLDQQAALAAVAEHRWDDAEQHLRAALRIATSTWSDDDFRVPAIQTELSRIDRYRQLDAESLELFDRMLELDDASRVAAEAADHDRALALARQQKEVASRLFPPDSPEVARADFAVAWQQTGEPHLPAEYERLALLYEQHVGGRHPDYAYILQELVNLAPEPDAATLERAALVTAIHAAANGADSSDYAAAVTVEGRQLLFAGRYEAAEKKLLEAKTRLENLGETDGRNYLDVLSDLGSVRNYQDAPLQALPLIEQALELARQLDVYTPGELSTLINESANTYYSIGRYDRSRELYVEALELEQHSPDRVECNYRMVLRNTADLFFEEGNYGEAVKYSRELFDACLADPQDCHLACVDGFLGLAAAYRMQQQYVKARLVLDRFEAALDEWAFPAGLHQEYTARIELQRIALLRDYGLRPRAAEQLTRLCGRLTPAGDDSAKLDDPAKLRGDAAEEIELANWMGLLSELYAMADSLELYDLGLGLREHYLAAARIEWADQPWEIAAVEVELNETRSYRQLTDEQRERLATAEALWEEGATLKRSDAPARSLAKFRQAAAIEAEVRGSRHRQTADRLVLLAQEELEFGQIEQSNAHFAEAIRIRETLLTGRHLETAAAKRLAAVAAQKAIRYDRAEQLLQEALEAEKQVLGDEHVQLGDTLHGLAKLYHGMGRYAAALPFAHDACQRLELRDGAQSVSYANALRTVYAIYDELGEKERAREALERSHQILVEISSPSDINLLDSIYTRAMEASLEPEEQTAARALFDELLASLESARLHRTERFARGLAGRGDLAARLGDYETARQAYLRALDLRRQIYDQADHPLIAELQMVLGSTALAEGNLAEAERSLEIAYQLQRQRLGDQSHQLTAGLYQLAYVRALRGDRPAALEMLTTCFEIEQVFVNENLVLGSEQAIADVLSEGDGKLALLLTLQLAGEANAAAVESALRWTLGRKGLALDLACRLQNAKRSLIHQPQAIRALTEIQSLRRALAEDALQADAVDAMQRKLAQRRIAQLQQELTTLVQDEGLATATAEIDLAALRARLPENTALIEYVVTPLVDLDAAGLQQTPEHVLAFFVPAAATAPCRLIDLGPAAEIEAHIEAVRKHIARTPRLLRVASEAELEQQFRRLSAELYERLLGPLHADLAKLDAVTLAPDGQLHQTPFAALAAADDPYLIEQMAISFVSSGRDLLREHGTPGVGALILADPDYDATIEARSTAAAQATGAASETALAVRGASPATRSLRWRPLPGARQEAADVAALLDQSPFEPVQAFVGSEAAEEVFKSTITPRLVHIATHGFYVPHDLSEAEATLAPVTPSGTGLGRLRRDRNPLLRSGIVLAGANQLSQSEGAPERRVDDGWVTAQEIASMDFRNTELVVLSACESGLGEARVGQGVHGLRRALLIAGAHRLLTSLFEVPDQETSQLMGDFYRSLIARKHPDCALQEAQQTMIARRRADHQAAHPFYWASFIVVGRPENAPPAGP